MVIDNDKLQKSYSDGQFFSKAKKLGAKVLKPALILYHAARDQDTPMWAKSTIYGALGYLISPIDAIPDITPVVGYTDDFGVLMVAISAVAVHIKQEHKQKAEQILKDLYGSPRFARVCV